MTSIATGTTVRPLVAAGVFLGVGLGGFVDGIVLHQLLQWHHMLTAHDHGRFPATTVEGLEVNTLWDGIFHTGTWIATVAGVGQLWYATTLPDVRWSFLVFVGSLLLGWGGFNLIEGLVDHHLLGIHHVRDDLGGPLGWDLAFLASGVMLMLAGWGLLRAGERS